MDNNPRQGDTTLVDEQTRAERLRSTFASAYGTQPDFVARAPGRVNLIGEHTDYNGGFVLPVAIDRTTLIAARLVPGSRQVEAFSANYGNRATFDLDNIEPAQDPAVSWSNYVRGVAWALMKKGLAHPGQVPGAQFAIEGNVPEGAGLSSSAAIEVAAALSFTRLAGVEIQGVELALACQLAENEFVGVKSGIMDQFISALAQPDSALLIDTRTLRYEPVPVGLDEIGYTLVAVDSAVPRSLITSAYNQRRSECEHAIRLLQPLLGLPTGAQLRDVTLDQLESRKTTVPDLLYRRARHVISENERTLQAFELMRAGLAANDNLRRLGKLLYASHASLRDDYDVSSKELDLLVDLARQVPGVIGARMTGAGFGGCTANIVSLANLALFRDTVVEEYRKRASLPARIHICRLVGGGSYIS